MFRGVSPQIEIRAAGAVVYFLAGILVAVLGALLPALDAARTPPARALKAGDEQTLFERIAPLWPGLVLLAAGGALAQLGPVHGVPLFGYAAIALPAGRSDRAGSARGANGCFTPCPCHRSRRSGSRSASCGPRPARRR